jgi:hypothetical protein
MDWGDSLWLSPHMQWQGVGTLVLQRASALSFDCGTLFVPVRSFAAAVCGTRFDVAELEYLSFLLPRTAATQARRKGRWQLQIGTLWILEK